jgi:deoxyribodipyrimidine photo-lyase
LTGLNNKDIHNPAAMGGLFGVADYPRPIVDLGSSRTRALAAFKRLPQLAPAAQA